MRHNEKSDLTRILRIIISSVLIVLILFAAVACKSSDDDNLPGQPPYPDIPDKVENTANRIADFSDGAGPFYPAHGYSNGGMFGCVWSRDSITYNNGAMQIGFDKNGGSGNNAYRGGEMRTYEDYGYGYYSTSMKPSPKVGLISSFFTYVGRSGTSTHHEIDIEFLGKSMNIVQFNHFGGGVGGHEYVYELGFDASEDFHVYGFEWKEDSIVWFVDGKAVHKSTVDIPVTPGKIMMNVWNPVGGFAESWVGKFEDNNMPTAAEYEWVAFVAN